MTKERVPLGKYPYRIKISREELQIAVQHREVTGEPIQSWVRRLIREAKVGQSPQDRITEGGLTEGNGITAKARGSKRFLLPSDSASIES